MNKEAMIEFQQAQPREMLPAMLRGFAGRCPHCGEGKMFRAFLKVADHCPKCGEALHHHRADDAPAYFVILIVGHIVVPIALSVELSLSPALWLSMVLWPSLTLVLSVALLQPVKGALVAWQWALRMHGFDPNDPESDAEPNYVKVRTKD